MQRARPNHEFTTDQDCPFSTAGTHPPRNFFSLARLSTHLVRCNLAVLHLPKLKSSNMSTFCPFPRLPLEVRQSIWAMALTPRAVGVGDSWTGQKRGPLPPLLEACREARSFLLAYGYYIKSFVDPKSGQYQYVNFTVDTVHLYQYDLDKYPREAPQIRWLAVGGRDSESFTRNHSLHLRTMSALKLVTIIHQESGPGHNEWWSGWDTLMETYYFRDDPKPFDVRILGPPDVEVPEITRHNYLHVEREQHRKLWAEHPDLYESDHEVSDTDDELDTPGRFRLGWRHVRGCNCPSRQPGAMTAAESVWGPGRYERSSS